MKKIIKIVFYNVLILLVLFLICEFFMDVYRYHVKYRKVSKLNPNYTLPQKITGAAKELFTAYIQNKNFYKVKEFREPFITNNGNAAILLIGCSFTYGDKIANNETLASHLNKHLNTTVYNMGLNGGSPREMLYMLREDTSVVDKYTHNDNNIQLVIYTFIDDHLRRLYSDSRPRVPRYKLSENGELIYLQPIPHSELFENVVKDNIPYILPDTKQYQLFNAYMLNTNNAIKNKYGENVKFVIFVFDERKKKNPYWKQLENAGIIIINVKDLTTENMRAEKYLASDGAHPNKEVWEILAPIFVQKLNSLK